MNPVTIALQGCPLVHGLDALVDGDKGLQSTATPFQTCISTATNVTSAIHPSHIGRLPKRTQVDPARYKERIPPATSEKAS